MRLENNLTTQNNESTRKGRERSKQPFDCCHGDRRCSTKQEKGVWLAQAVLQFMKTLYRRGIAHLYQNCGRHWAAERGTENGKRGRRGGQNGAKAQVLADRSILRKVVKDSVGFFVFLNCWNEVHFTELPNCKVNAKQTKRMGKN